MYIYVCVQEVLALKTPVSAAQVQGHFQMFKDDPSRAVENVAELTLDRRLQTTDTPPS